MTIRKPTRKSAFRAALALAGMTQGEFAASQGVSDSQLSLVLDGKRQSDALDAAIDEFTAKHLPASLRAVPA